MRPVLYYIDDQTVGQISGATDTNLSRLMTLQAGREASANGTRREKTSVRQGGAANGITAMTREAVEAMPEHHH